MRRLTLTAVLVIFFVSFAAAGTAAAQQTFNGCGIAIDSSGGYGITQNIDNGSTCVEINASDVVLDGNGNSVTGMGNPDEPGILINGTQGGIGNVTVTNLTVEGWGGDDGVGLEYRSVTEGTVSGLEATDNGVGISLVDSSGNEVSGTTSEANEVSDVSVVSGENEFVNLNIGASTEPSTTLSFTGNDVTVSGNETADETQNPDGFGIGRYFDAESVGSDAFLNVSLRYEGGDIPDRVDERALSLWNLDSGEWNRIDSDIDTSAQVLSADITTFSTFGAFGEEVVTPAEFDVEIVDTTTPNAGENLDVSAEITNVGEESGKKNITLRTSDTGGTGTEVRDERPLELNAGESKEIVLTWNTTGGDAGEYLAEVGVPSGGDTTRVTVAPAQTDPKFEVGIDSTTAPVQAGDGVGVVSTVRNVGNVAGNVTVELSANASVRDSKTVYLDGGDERSVGIVWETTENDVGDRNVEVSTETDSDTEVVEIGEPPTEAEFDVGIVGTTEPVRAGETLGVEAEITNLGDTEGEETVELLVGGEVVDNRTVGLGGGDDRTVALIWSTEEGDVGNVPIEVATRGNSDTTTVAVEDPPTEAAFDVEIVETTAPVEAGETIEVEAEVENVGEEDNDGTVELVARGEVRDTRDIELKAEEPGDIETVVFEWETTEDDAGERLIEVSPRDRVGISDAESVEIEEPPEDAKFDIDIVGNTSPVAEGNTLELAVKVENVGEKPGEADVSLAVAGQERDTTTVNLDAGDSRPAVLRWETTQGDDGEFIALVETQDDGAT